MGLILTASVFFAALYFIAYKVFFLDKDMKNTGETPYVLGIVGLILLSFVIRIFCAAVFYGHESDMSCFIGWSRMIYEGGFRNFYISDSFTDYPPGYMYILYVVGWIGSFVGHSSVLVKLPSILADIVAGIVVYKVSRKRFCEVTSIALSSFILLNPVLILNSSIWGQVDIIYTLLLFVSILYLTEKKYTQSYLIFAIAIFVKPQALMFGPVYLFSLIDYLSSKPSAKKMFAHFGSIVTSVLMIFVLSVPFGINETIGQYIQTLKSYPYATVNAFNLYGLFGLNWQPLTTVTSIAGTVGILSVVAFVFVLYIRGQRNWFKIAGILSFGVYMLSTKMHDRYAFPAVVFFLMSYVQKPSTKSMWVFILAVVSQLVNTAWVLFVYETDINLYAFSSQVNILSAINILVFAYVIYASLDNTKEEKPKIRRAEISDRKYISRPLPKMVRKDYILMFALTLVYGAISFYNLGSTVAPESYSDLAQESVTITFDSPEYINSIAVYPSCNDINEDRSINVTLWDSQGQTEQIILDSQSVFTWNFADLDREVERITFSTDSSRLMIMEMGLIGENGLIEVNSESKLFDEQNTVPERTTHKNSAYFDEIYHARTAYEFIHGFNVYEWTHPPLGKVFISLGIRLFGMNTFGWRFVGNLFGIIMVPVFYVFAKKLFDKTHIAFLTTVLFTFDFMHFAQTRIATIDVYVTLFIMLMYLFMYKYYSWSIYDKPLAKTLLPLLLTGIAFGLGTASKWTAAYACIGIALVFFAKMYMRYDEFYRLRTLNKVELPFVRKFVMTCGFCLLAFIIIPVIIYGLSYIPYLSTESGDGIKSIIQNQTDAFVYHSKTVLDSSHPFSSRWFTWPIMVRPIWYYSGRVTDQIKEGISSFGNPAVWWVSIPLVIYNIYLAISKKDRKSIYLLVGYFACLLPWMPVERTTYIYHYFPCVPFATLMIGHSFRRLYDKNPSQEKKLFISLSVVAVLLFVLFYPVLSGQPISVDFVEKYLQWFSSWILI